MSVRALDLLDLPSIYKYRNEVLSLDTARELTRGNPLGAVGLLAYINPARHLYSAIHSENGFALLGGVIHTRNETFAKLLYLAPAPHLTHPNLPLLIEHLAAQAGAWGAFHVIAEVDEDSDAFIALRQSGFSVYAWQRMWKMPVDTEPGSTSGWMRMQDENLSAIQSLHSQIVPPLLNPIESHPKRANGFVCNEGARCYVNVSSGMAGIVLTPLIHPEAIGVGKKLTALTGKFSGKPVYLCVRSYQAWLEPVLEDLGAQPAKRQAVMVKHLAHLIKNEKNVKATQPTGVTVQPSRINRIQLKKK
jgi:hypothetical protein